MVGAHTTHAQESLQQNFSFATTRREFPVEKTPCCEVSQAHTS